MTPDLAAFSDWTLALLPRLFLYPGGVGLLAALLLLRWASGETKFVSVGALASDLGRANLLSVALAWACVAVLPFPGASALPSQGDALVLAALPALSLLVDISATGGICIAAAGAITLALLLPAVEGSSLLATSESSAVLLVVCSLAVLAGLLALSMEGHAGIASEARWVAWFCLGLVPLWQRVAGDSAWAAGLFVLAGVLVLNGAARLPLLSRLQARQVASGDPGLRLQPVRIAVASAWLLGLAALLWVLLAAS